MENTSSIKLVDRDGDVWVQNENGTFRHEEFSSCGFLDEWTRDAIERMYGPTTTA
jgi:hypothetical protein